MSTNSQAETRRARPVAKRPSDPHPRASALEPAANALLVSARERAAVLADDAEACYRSVVERAGNEAERMLEEARSQGEAAAVEVAAQELARSRQEARAIVLAARRRAYEAVREAALQGLAACASTPDALALRDRLAALVRERLGADVSVTSEPALDVWASAETADRRCVLSAAMLVDHALASRTIDLEALWR